MKKNNIWQTVIEMCFGLILFEVILIVIAALFYKVVGYTLLSLVLGVIVGALAAIGMLVDIAYTTEDTMASKDAGYANKKTIIHSVARKVVLIIILAIFWNSTYVNVIAVVIASLGLKPGAYLQPTAHKIFVK